MDPIITQWNSEWVTGPGGVVFLMQKQTEALCMLLCPAHKNAWVTFGTTRRLAGGKSWQQSQTGVFSCRACQFVKWRGSSLLLFYTFVYRCEMSNVRGLVFFFFSCSLMEQRSRCCPFVWHLVSLFERCVVVFVWVCVCACWYSSSVFLCHIKLVRGWERGY